MALLEAKGLGIRFGGLKAVAKFNDDAKIILIPAIIIIPNQ